MIEKYLFEILENNNRVIIPDFGALIKSSGKSNNIFFNEFIKVNDKKLVNLIIEKKEVSKNEATQEIAEFIKDAKKDLSEKKKFDIQGIGSLFKDEKGRIRLKMDEKAKKGGLSATPIIDKPVVKEEKTIKKKEEDKKKEKTKEKAKIIYNTKKTKKSKAMKTSNPPKKNEASKEKKNRKPIIIGLIIIILIIIILVLGFLFKDKIFGTSSNNEVVKKEVVKTEADKQKEAQDLAAEKARIAAEKKAAEEKARKAAEEKAKKEEAEKHKKYYLVGGVFKHDQNADDYLTELEYDGFPAAKFANIKGLNYLCYNSFNDMKKTKAELQRIKDKGYEVWILKY